MNIKIGILNVLKHGNKHDLIHFVTVSHMELQQKDLVYILLANVTKTLT